MLYLFAEASRKGKTVAFTRENTACNGARAALGFGVDFDASPENLEFYGAFLCKGLASAKDRQAYLNRMNAGSSQFRDLYEFGERRHATPEMAKTWIEQHLPRYETPAHCVVFKPLCDMDPEDDLKAVIFPVTPVELSGLMTLVGSVIPQPDTLLMPQGADCNRITSFVVTQEEKDGQRAVLGMIDVDGREVMRRRFRDEVVTIALPADLFWRAEKESDHCILQIPGWRRIVNNF